MKFSIPMVGHFELRKLPIAPQNVNLESLNELTSELLSEVVREGEARIAAQTTSHLATDQRGFTIAGIQLTVATAAFAAYISALVSDQSSWISLYTLILAAGMFLAAACALVSVWPKRFCIPGNEPKNWLPVHWVHARTLKGARLEQCAALQSQISDNRLTARTKAYCQIASLLVSFGTVFTCAATAIFC